MEFTIKEALLWSRSQWNNNKVAGLGFKSLINSLKFWSLQLSPAMKPNNVILKLYNPERRPYVSLQLIVNAILKISESIAITGYARFKNKRYISISFNDCETRNLVVDKLKCVNSDYVIFLHWACLQAITCNVFWLSNDTDLVHVMEFLSRYIQVSFIEQLKTILDNNMVLPSGSFRAGGVLNESISINDIPHFDIIDGLQVLITIPGRNSVCYKCLETGHLARCCAKRFCGRCRGNREGLHVCTKLSDFNTEFVSNVVSSVQNVSDRVLNMDLAPDATRSTSQCSLNLPLSVPVMLSAAAPVVNQVLSGNDVSGELVDSTVLLAGSLSSALVEAPPPSHLVGAVAGVSESFFTDPLCLTLDTQGLTSSSEEEDSLSRVNQEVAQYEFMLQRLQDTQVQYVQPAWLRSSQPSPYLDQKLKKQERELKHRAKNTKKKLNRKT